MREARIYWASTYKPELVGNAYGYKVHNETLKKYVAKIAELSEDAPNAVVIASPEFYRQRTGAGVDFLFTMFEGTTVPDKYRASIMKADYLLSPSHWVKNTLSRYFTERKIFVVPHGVEPIFAYAKRKFPKGRKKFRFLWVGAPNPRKGYEEVSVVWKHAGFSRVANLELYMKTTGRPDSKPRVEKKGNVVLDSRNLSKKQLVQLYHSAHCFLFPSRGEGFGLTLAEAMRTGLPCIGTHYSGQTDFFNVDVGLTLPYKIGKGKMTFWDKEEAETDIAYPDVDVLAEKMFWALNNYPKALQLGRAAHDRIKKKFTWERSAERLVSIIKGYGKD